MQSAEWVQRNWQSAEGSAECRSAAECRVQSAECRVQCRVQSAECRVQCRVRNAVQTVSMLHIFGQGEPSYPGTQCTALLQMWSAARCGCLTSGCRPLRRSRVVRVYRTQVRLHRSNSQAPPVRSLELSDCACAVQVTKLEAAAPATREQGTQT